ncbi:PE family protein [Mycobacterium interjectum]|uniref:PE family protein n=1 Tax=Mycobacterium interjectum TaxID=33895 RepID=UPI00082B7F74|nr:PE family protein [Mycobacterium interjectum]MCV7092658.1 PE family protein [Mycobacterium interjectum]
MSYLVAAPDEIGAAAQNLAGIRSLLAGSAASAAAPTTAVAAAARDEVSALVAAMFNNFGQEFQMINAQANEFHGEFVGLIKAGAGAYQSTEVANAAAAATGAMTAPAQGLLVQSVQGAAGATPSAADLSLGGGNVGVPSIVTGGVPTLSSLLGGGQLTVPPVLRGGLLGLLARPAP